MGCGLPNKIHKFSGFLRYPAWVETLPVGSGKTGPWPLLSLFLLDVSGTSLLLRFARAHKSLLDSTSTSRCANFLFSTVVSQKICSFCAFLNVTAVRTSVDVFLILSTAQLLGAQKSLGIASNSGTIDVPDSTQFHYLPRFRHSSSS